MIVKKILWNDLNFFQYFFFINLYSNGEPHFQKLYILIFFYQICCSSSKVFDSCLIEATDLQQNCDYSFQTFNEILIYSRFNSPSQIILPKWVYDTQTPRAIPAVQHIVSIRPTKFFTYMPETVSRWKYARNAAGNKARLWLCSVERAFHPSSKINGNSAPAASWSKETVCNEILILVQFHRRPSSALTRCGLVNVEINTRRRLPSAGTINAIKTR